MENDELNDEFLSSIIAKAEPLQSQVNYRMKLAAKIINGIRAKGWNNSRFALEIGESNPDNIARWLSGTNNFKADTLFQIEQLLEITLLDLTA